jgi:hypothetical protein
MQMRYCAACEVYPQTSDRGNALRLDSASDKTVKSSIATQDVTERHLWLFFYRDEKVVVGQYVRSLGLFAFHKD